MMMNLMVLMNGTRKTIKQQQQTQRYLENNNPDTFFNTKNGGINMVERFTITTTIVENGYLHYKVHDNLTGDEIHCELNELNESIWQLLGV